MLALLVDGKLNFFNPFSNDIRRLTELNKKDNKLNSIKRLFKMPMPIAIYIKVKTG
jgi:hypothetical protein